MENKVLWDLEGREGSGSGIWSTRSMSRRNLPAGQGRCVGTQGFRVCMLIEYICVKTIYTE